MTKGMKNPMVGLILATLLATGGLARSAEKAGPANADELTIEGRIVSMDGACNALRCPVIRYEIETLKIASNFLFPEKSDYELAAFAACGESGLKLGNKYRFNLKRVQPELVSDFDRPVNSDGQYLQCDVYFEVVPLLLPERSQ